MRKALFMGAADGEHEAEPVVVHGDQAALAVTGRTGSASMEAIRLRLWRCPLRTYERCVGVQPSCAAAVRLLHPAAARRFFTSSRFGEVLTGLCAFLVLIGVNVSVLTGVNLRP